LLAAVARELPRPEFAKFLQKPGISDIARNMGECQTGERLLQLYLGQDDSGDASRSVIDNALYLISVVGLRLGPHEIREIMRKRARRLKWDNAPVADYAEADLRVSHKVGLALTAFEWPKEYA